MHEEQQGSIWDLMLEVLVSPREGMEKVAERRPVGPALGIIIGLSLFALAMRLAGGPPAIDSFPTGLNFDFAQAMNRLMPMLALAGSLLGSVGLLAGWFLRSAIYRLLGELMIGPGDGRAMLATLGFAALPGLLQPPLELMTSRVQVPGLSFLVGLALWVWTAILAVMAIRASFRSSTGQAVAVFLIPIGALIGFLILGFILMMISMVSAVPSL